MRNLADRRIWVLAASALACSACVSAGSPVFGTSKESSASATDRLSLQLQFGDEFSVQATIAAIKAKGSQDRVSSRAIRLPERPLGEIAVFDYRFPPSCGDHQFRVLEAKDIQILEYNYAGVGGNRHMIRDYVSGTSPFVQAGLWSAFDHTADSIATMSSQFEQRGDGMFNGVYSQGLVTGLPAMEQRQLGNAYQKAVSDAFNCQDTRTLAGLAAGE